MPKLKSKKSCTKRIRINKNGVVKHGVSFKNHQMNNKCKRRTRAHGTQRASKAMMLVVRKVYPYSAIRRQKRKIVNSSISCSTVNNECINTCKI
jgi:ribosomal protein L35